MSAIYMWAIVLTQTEGSLGKANESIQYWLSVLAVTLFYMAFKHVELGTFTHKFIVLFFLNASFYKNIDLLAGLMPVM